MLPGVHFLLFSTCSTAIVRDDRGRFPALSTLTVSQRFGALIDGAFGAL
jgi:hypothetical protein